MGSVWYATHTSLGHGVAVKFIHPDLARSPQARRRFDTEAKAAAKLKSRHVAQVYDHGVSDTEQPYIVMEFLEGHSLESVIESTRRAADERGDPHHRAGRAGARDRPSRRRRSPRSQARQHHARHRPGGQTLRLHGETRRLRDRQDRHRRGVGERRSHPRRGGGRDAALHGAGSAHRFAPGGAAVGRLVARSVRLQGDGRQGAFRRRRHRGHRHQGVRLASARSVGRTGRLARRVRRLVRQGLPPRSEAALRLRDASARSAAASRRARLPR